MTNGRKPTVSDEEIIQYILHHEDPAVFTGDVADHIGLRRDSTLTRLKQLEEDGMVKSRKGGQSRVWWVPTHVADSFESEL